MFQSKDSGSHMRANGNCSDANFKQLHSVRVNCVMSLSDAVDLASPLNWCYLYLVTSI